MDAAASIAQLRSFQTALGGITDRTTLLRAIDAFAREHPREGARLATFRRRIDRERQRLMARYLPELV